MDKDKRGNHLRVWLESECRDSPRSGLDIITEEARPGGAGRLGESKGSTPLGFTASWTSEKGVSIRENSSNGRLWSGSSWGRGI